MGSGPFGGGLTGTLAEPCYHRAALAYLQIAETVFLRQVCLGPEVGPLRE